jgi:hypothetical protein
MLQVIRFPNDTVAAVTEAELVVELVHERFRLVFRTPGVAGAPAPRETTKKRLQDSPLERAAWVWM